ncbi:MAG TPA: START domain-containing protein [Mucilaginibacter sp.]|nr:START domain-containing protein [Mucilaginibacter sp.]
MYKLSIIALLLVIRIHPLFGQNEWKLKTEKEGIKVYAGVVPDSKIKAVKAVGEYNATASELVALLMDIKTSPNWVYHVKSCKMINQVSPLELYYYLEISVPWPASNRDLVVHLKVSQDPDTKTITIDAPAVPGLVPVKKGIVRINESIGKWTITPLGTDQISVEYVVHVNPGGSVPSWLVNLFATDGPFEIFKHIRLELQKDAYKDTVLSYLKN